MKLSAFPKSIFALGLLVLVAWCYWPALHGPFVFDDQVNILENPGVVLQDLSTASLTKAMFSNESGQFKRILPALSFGLNYYFAQGFANTFVFKMTNLTIHLLNSLLVFALVWQLAPKLFGQRASQTQLLLGSFFIAVLWAVHPLQVSTVMYVVQRMTSMATVFMLLGLNGYVWARNRLSLERPIGLLWMFLALLIGVGLGLTSKENAVLLPLYAAVLEFTLYGTQPMQKRIVYFYALLLGVPFVVGVYLFLTDHFNFFAGYYLRPFTLQQRLLTEARVLWFYVQMLLWPDIRVMGLYHDDLPLSKSWLDPLSTLWSIAAWALMLVLAWWYRLRLPVLSFAIAWFLVGHSMESSIIPLEIIFEHRNYLPALGLMCLLVYAVFALLARFNTSMLPVTAVLLLLSSVYATLTWQRAHYWESEESLFRSLAQNNAQSPISLYSYAELLNKKKQQTREAYRYYLQAVALNKDSVSLAMQATLSAPRDQAIDPMLQPERIRIALNKHHLAPFDLSVLDDSARCVLSKTLLCAEHMQDVRSWLHAAIDNNGLDQDWRRAFVQSVFDIEMQYGLPAEALKTVTQAQAQDGRVFYYYLLKANALQALGRYEDALAIIATAEQLAQQYNPKLLNDVYRLKNQVVNTMQAGVSIPLMKP